MRTLRCWWDKIGRKRLFIFKILHNRSQEFIYWLGSSQSSILSSYPGPKLCPKAEIQAEGSACPESPIETVRRLSGKPRLKAGLQAVLDVSWSVHQRNCEYGGLRVANKIHRKSVGIGWDASSRRIMTLHVPYLAAHITRNLKSATNNKMLETGWDASSVSWQTILVARSNIQHKNHGKSGQTYH